MIDVDIQPGIKQLIKDLKDLSDDLERKAIRSGMVAAARPLKQALQAAAPKDRGNLAKAIGHNVLSKSAVSRITLITGPLKRTSVSIQDGGVALLVGPNRNVNGYRRGFIGAVTEFGTKPHIIKPRKKNKSQTLRLRGGELVKMIKHPGTKGQFWMANAHASAQAQVNKLFYQGLAHHLDKQKQKAE